MGKLKKAVQLRKVFKHKVKRLARKEHHIERRFKHTRCKAKKRYKKGLVKLQKRERSAKHHVHITRVVLVRSNEREAKARRKMHHYWHIAKRAKIVKKQAAMKEKCNKKKRFLHRKRRALKWDKKTHHLQHIFKAWDHQKKKYLQLRKVEKEKAKKLNRKKHAEERAMKRSHGKVRARHGSKLERLIKRERVAKHHAHKAKRVVKKATKHENKCTKKLHVFQEKGTKAA